jgi:hypothetical protein
VSPLLCVILVLLFSPLLVGHDGEELEEGSGGTGGFPFSWRFSLTQALRRGAWWSSSLLPGGPSWGRQAVWVLKTVPPLNNVQLLLSLILDRGSSVFLLAERGG